MKWEKLIFVRINPKKSAKEKAEIVTKLILNSVFPFITQLFIIPNTENEE